MQTTIANLNRAVQRLSANGIRLMRFNVPIELAILTAPIISVPLCREIRVN